MSVLKTKASKFGFSRKEMRKVGNLIVDSLPDDVEEEELDELIKKKVDEYLPLLQLSQSAADRMASRISKPKDDDDDSDDDDEPKKGKKSKKGKKQVKSDDDDDDIDDDDFKDAPAWAKKLYKMAQNGNGYKHQSSRRGMVEEAVHGSGFLGKHILKEFEKKEFKSDEDFEEYLYDVRDEVEQYEKERRERGLEKLAVPPGGRTRGSIYHKSVYDDDTMTDDEVRKLARG